MVHVKQHKRNVMYGVYDPYDNQASSSGYMESHVLNEFATKKIAQKYAKYKNFRVRKIYSGQKFITRGRDE